MNSNLERLCKMVVDFREYQKSTLPLCAAENIMSEFCKLPLSEGFQERYIMGSAYNYSEQDNFIGSHKLLPYYQMLSEKCEEQYHTKYNDARTLTGMNCINMILMALTKPYDKIMILDKEWGGHASVKGICERLGLQVYTIPYRHELYDFDYNALNEIVEKEKIQFILPAPSDILFQLNLENIDTSKTLLLDDASQTLGMIGTGVHKNPICLMNENVVLIGGTHKTVPGPAHGLAMTNNEDVFKILDTGINPKYLRNTQMHQVISLLFTLVEQGIYGEEYQKYVVKCGNLLGQKLEERGFQVAKKNNIYMETHQIFIECDENMMKKIYRNALAVGVTLNTKTKRLFHGGYGIRLGLQEIGRYGWDSAALEIIAEIFSLLACDDFNENITRELLSRLPGKIVHYTFTEEELLQFKTEIL